MPSNKVEDDICNVYELDNSSNNQRVSHLSQAFGGNWPLLDYNRWVGPPTLNRNPPLQPLDSLKGPNVESLLMPLNQNYNSYGGSTCYDQQILNSRALSIFKSYPENECADSPTLTTNSELSEITEASGDYNFHKGQQQFLRDEVNAPKPQIMQQPGYNDMQLLQQHMMFKQLQEFQRQQQQSSLNQFSVSPRQPAGSQFPPLINGTPIHNTQMLRSWITPQQNDVSLYGTNARTSMSQYPHFQAPKSVLQSSGYGNPSLGDQNAVLELQMSSNFAQIPVQGLNSGNFPGNPREGNVAGAKEFDSSQGLVPLDPMEAKILYNMDENIWDAFGNRTDTVAAVEFGNTLENPDSNSFSSFQCGTWSALMQSAVAEASSSDTGLQEEWSGLTFQNTEQSTDNHISSFVESEKQQASWVDNNFSSKPFPFPGFHQPGMQFLAKQREDFGNDSSHESTVNYFSQKPSVHDSEKSQQFVHSDNTWTGQMFDKGSHSMVNSQHHKSNGPHVAVNSYEGAHESQEKWQYHTHQQRENSNDSSKGLTTYEKGHGEHLKFFGNFSSGAMNVDKRSIPNFQGTEEVPSRGVHGSNDASTSFHRSVLPRGSNVSAQTSEHMLELLNKVDQSNNDSTFKQFGSTDYSPLAEMQVADSRDTSMAQIYMQSSSSQGSFGLRLAPPQKLTNPNIVLNSRQVDAELGEKSQARHTPFSFNSSIPAHELAQRTHWDSKSGSPGPTCSSPHANMQGISAVSSSPNRPETRSQVQINQSGLPATSQSSRTAPPGSTSRFYSFNQIPSQDTLLQMQTNFVSQTFPISGTVPVSQQGEISAGPYNVWKSVSTQRQTFSDSPSYLESTNNNISGTSLAPYVPVDQSTVEGGYISSEVSTSSYLQGEEQQHISSSIPEVEHNSNATTLNSGLLASQQLQALNNAGKASDIQYAAALGGQQFQNNISRFRNLVDGRLNTSQTNCYPPADAQVLGVSAEARDGSAVKVPSQYGTPKNGQISQMFDGRLAKAAALQVSLGNPSQNLHMESPLKQMDGIVSAAFAPSEIMSQVAVMRPKKRKFMVPWQKEVMQETKRPQNISVAEQDWAQATNRLIEKVEDEVDMNEISQPIHRAKRRFVLTTQLVQQLLPPPPASIFSATNYSILSYFVSRLSLGDASSFSYCSVNDFLSPPSKNNTNSEKPKSESYAQQILEVVNNSSDRTKLLENELERLDKSASIATIRAELMELERFSVINRFAKFHVRGQIDGTSSPKVSPQRQVTAIPVPQYLPEGEQCLSL